MGAHYMPLGFPRSDCRSDQSDEAPGSQVDADPGNRDEREVSPREPHDQGQRAQREKSVLPWH
jgi:hypothetical protein